LLTRIDRPRSDPSATASADVGFEEVEVLGDLGSDLAHGQPRRRQQDAERQATSQAKDLCQRVKVNGLQNEPGPDPAGGLDE
jgi:hypothetical protein